MTDVERLAALLREAAGNCVWATWNRVLTSQQLAEWLLARGVVLPGPQEPSGEAIRLLEYASGCGPWAPTTSKESETAEANWRKEVRAFLESVPPGARPDAPPEPSENAIEAAREASGVVRDQPDNLLGRRMVIAVLRAAYAIDFGVRVASGTPETHS